MSNPFEPLQSGEFELTEDETLLRQITPPLMNEKDSIPASTAFGPANIDKGMPSFARSTKVSPEESREWHNANARQPSLGVWGCSVSEVLASREPVGADTRSVDDARVETESPKSPGHCYVDYRHLSKDERRLLRAELLMYAIDRGEILGAATA